MNIDGSDVKLKLVRKTESKRRDRVGKRSSETYAAGDLTIIIRLVVNRVCNPNDENCESTEYKATFTVKRGARKRFVSTAGSCGC